MKITILGRDVDIRYNVATQIAYERITGKPIQTIADQQLGDVTAIAFASIVANNPGCDLTMEDILYRASSAEFGALTSALNAEIMAWAGIPTIAEAHVPPADEGADADSKKKA